MSNLSGSTSTPPHIHMPQAQQRCHFSGGVTNGGVMSKASNGVTVKPQPPFCRGDSAAQAERGYRCTLPSRLQRANVGSSDATSKGVDDA